VACPVLDALGHCHPAWRQHSQDVGKARLKTTTALRTGPTNPQKPANSDNSARRPGYEGKTLTPTRSIPLKRLLPLLALSLTACQVNLQDVASNMPALIEVANRVAVAVMEMENSELGGRIRLPELSFRQVETPIPPEGIVTRNEQMGPVRVEHTQLPGGRSEVWIANTHPFDVSVAVDLELNGFSAEEQQKTAVVPGEGRVKVAVLRLASTGEARWNCRMAYTLGRVNATHEDVTYVLPYALEGSHPVGQPYFGQFSHQERHALDFTMPEGTPIRAARAGVVCDVVQEFSEGGTDESFRKKGNVIRVMHTDGTLATYAHLKKDGALVAVGEKVSAGQRIGLSGNKGFSSGPHLHFEVYAPEDVTANKMKTFPTRFETASGLKPGIDFKGGDRVR
jgi:hypothetical protein